MENGIRNYQESSIFSEGFMNFGPQMAKNGTFVFTRPVLMLQFASYPAFANVYTERESAKLRQIVGG